MNEAQLKTFVRHAFQLSDAGLKTAKKANPVLADVMLEVRRMVEALPNPEHITRELVWKSLQPQVKRLMMQYNDALGRELAQSLVDMQPGDVMAAGKQMEHIGIKPSPESLQPPPISAGELKVNDVKLQKWFSSGNNELSIWAKSNFDSINKTVQRGIFEALPTNDIAKQIIQEAGLGGIGGTRIAGNTQAGKIYRQAQTLARTAIAEQNHQINEQVWDANKEAMEAAGVEYEWVAALDSKTCPTCAPLDGQTYKSREAAPPWPIHMNCRCSVVASTDSDDLRQQTGQEISKEPFKYKGKTLKEISGGKPYKKMSPKQKAEWDEATSKGGLYASKVKVNGEWYHRKTKTSQGKNYADYIGKANKETQVQFFGSERRAEVFRKQVADGRDPREAMVAMLRGSKDDKTWRPSKTQAEKGVTWKKNDQVKATWKPSAKKVPVAAKAKPKAAIATQKAELQQAIAEAKKSAAAKLAKPVEPEVKVTVPERPSKPGKAPPQPKFKTKDTNYDYDKNWEKLGYKDRKAYKKVRSDVVEWTGNEFEGVRAAQFYEAQKAGLDLNSYESLEVRRLEKGEHRYYGKMGERLEEFVQRAPKYEGTLRRGVALNTKEEVMDMIERYSKGEKGKALESWTTDKGVSDRFAWGNRKVKPQRVTVLVEDNRVGAPINAISGFDDEFEVLVPKGVRYELLEVQEQSVKGKGKDGGPVYGMDHTNWVVKLRQVVD